MAKPEDHAEWVWVQPRTPGEFEIPIGARVIRTDPGKALVRDDEGREEWVQNERILRAMHVTSQRGVEDMITLGDLQEHAILRNLCTRYNDKHIYTYIGSMLVALNPYEILPIYTNSLVNRYRLKKIGEEPPHIFAIGDNSYREMISQNRNQCVVISGESGAGKTESTKLILQYLAAISGKHQWIEQQILDSNPILEAFGNAKTVRNDNSSRFGKYIDIHFDDNGVIKGAKIEQYLLEKSRIVHQNQGERNYHIFYAMVGGLSKEEKKRLELEDATKYHYLTQGSTVSCDGKDEVNELNAIRAAMKVLSFDDTEIWEIMKLLAALLHLGNLKYRAISVQNIDASEVNDSTNAGRVASLLGLAKSQMVAALTRKTIFVQGERVVSSIAKSAALDARDAFVKAIYGKIFVRIVDKINTTIHQQFDGGRLSIGVLDIFGFENFDVNSFEQLCINYANENLQQFFVKHIFKMEQEEYTREGINWHQIEFVDNQSILDMIGMRPMNLMSLIDEETKFPRGTDGTMLSKLHDNHGTKTMYMKTKSDQSLSFGIRHFAGVVFYSVPGFLEKNRDSYSMDLKELIVQSSNPYLLELFRSESAMDTNKRSLTLSLQFRNSLEALMRTLSACQPSFVRCIKPNDFKKPKIIDRALCVRQLRYSGMMETAKIRRAGFPVRHTYKEFIDRYRHLLPGIGPSHKVDCVAMTKRICQSIIPVTASEIYQFGYSKVFLKDVHDTILEAERNRIYLKHIVLLQRNIRMVIFRRFIRKYRAAAIVLQKHWRARGYRQRYLAMAQGFARLQACIRSRQLAYTFLRQRKMITRLQACVRGYQTRQMVRAKLSDRSMRFQDLMQLRKQEEQQFKASGSRTWYEEAERNYYLRVQDVRKEIAIETEERSRAAIISAADEEQRRLGMNFEQENEVVDDLFKFLSETSPVPEPKNKVGSGETPPVSVAAIGTQKNESMTTSEGATQTMEDMGEGSISIPGEKPSSKEDLSQYSFFKYAATYFIGNNVHSFSSKLLRSSLLKLPSSMDDFSAQAIWMTILRFMGDMAEAKYEDDEEEQGDVPIMQKLNNTLNRAFVKTDDFKSFVGTLSENDRKRLVHMTLKRRSKLPEELRKLVESSEEMNVYQKWLNTRSSHLDKLHFIIGHGILRPELRDEIYCQIAKQLTKNPSQVSHSKGWILLSLCLGCFPPTEQFEIYLRSFIRSGPAIYAEYCENKLNRTIKNGTRRQPPSILELKASRSKAPIHLDVILTDGRSMTIEVDSASTSYEAIEQLGHVLKMKDRFGFSIYITLMDKALSLGAGKEHLMDAISNCEQYSKEQGISEKQGTWKLLLRKEMFTPWYNPSDCPIATDLIFRQIITGVSSGEFHCKSEKEVATFGALVYYGDHGSNLDEHLLDQVIKKSVPLDLLRSGDRSVEKWKKGILNAYKGSPKIQRGMAQLEAKEDIVTFAQISWPLLFSRFFECVLFQGPAVTKNLILAINCNGVFFLNDQEEVVLELSFPEILSTSFEKEDRVDSLYIHTVQKMEFGFKCFEAKLVSQLIDFLVNGLKKRSVYAVAIQNYSHPENAEGYLKLMKGDLVVLGHGFTGENINPNELWAYGESRGKEGDFPTEAVYMLPCLMPPSEEVLELFKANSDLKSKKARASQYNTIQRLRMHTLKKFAEEHFRSNHSSGNRKSAVMNSVKRANPDDLWRHSRDPLKAPLLLKLQNTGDLSNLAVNIFTLILKFMGDSPRDKIDVDTDAIFLPAMRDEMIRDEVYCQIMKQLTENRSLASEERGWELMYLSTGVMVPTSVLLKELTEFLRTRTHPLADISLNRLQKNLKNTKRVYPPYAIEVEAIRYRSLQIFHKIYFPDDTDQAFEIESSTRAKDLVNAITKRVELQSNAGFSLFVVMADKAFSIPEDVYIFDFIYEISEYTRANQPTRTHDNNNQVKIQYQIFFMKKLWINCTPGKDKNADQMFYYHQEVPKYLNGYYNVSMELAKTMAALIYRVRYGNSAYELQLQGQLIKHLMPEDLLTKLKANDLIRDLVPMINNLKAKSVEQCKDEFLQNAKEFPTFGSAFFVVKQTTIANFPATLIIAINKRGIDFVDARSKQVLQHYDFADLSFWSSGNTFFQASFGNMMGSKKLLCETSQGYKMDDLIASYTNLYKVD